MQVLAFAVILWLFQNIITISAATIPIDKCAKMNSDNLTCQYCVQNYYLDQFSKICTIQAAQDRFCIQKYDSICVRCDCGYLIVSDKNTCAKAIIDHRGCEVINPSKQCVRPKKEFVLSNIAGNIQIRYSKGTNCEIETDNFICLQCHSGYKMDGNRNCIQDPRNIDNIYYSYFFGDQLMSRNSFYTPGDFGVYPIIKYCSQHQGSGDGKTAICSKCYDGMIPNTARTVCFVQPCDFCKYAIEDTTGTKPVVKCQECENNNYFFVQSGTQDGTDYQICVARQNHYFDNCLVRNQYSDSCITCLNSFFNGPVNGQCQLLYWKTIQYQQQAAQMYGCNVMLRSGVCQECTKSFYLLNNICQAVPLNCLVLSSPGKCSQCSNLYFADSTASYTCSGLANPQSCVISDGINNSCKICQSKYFPSSSGVCTGITNSNNCVYTDGKGDYCNICTNLYFLSSNVCIQIPTYLLCIQSDGISKKCLQCKQFFSVDSNGNCISIYYTNQSSCLLIPAQYYDSTGCNMHTFTNYDQCLIYDQTSNKCLQCLNQYFINPNGECARTANKCYTNGKVDVCIVCESQSSYISNQVCTSTNCMTNSIQPSCTSCLDTANQPGYFAEDSSTPPILTCYTALTRDSNCIHFSNTKDCMLCKNMYYLQTGIHPVCTDISDQNCLYSDGNTDNCLLCQQGYYKSNGGTGPCQQTPILRCKDTTQPICSQCETGYFINSNTGLCMPNSNPNCSQSEGVQDICTTCNPNYNFIDSNYPNYCGFPFCKTPNASNLQKGCVECIPNYYLTTNGQCRMITITNCVQQISDTECSKCLSQYYLLQMNYGGVICQAITDIPNCILGDGIKLLCQQCSAANYYISSYGTCLKIDNCQTIDALQGICTQCNAGYSLSNDQMFCIQLQNCLLTDGKVCTKCKTTGYYLMTSNGIAVCALIRNCIASNGVDLICTTCTNGYEVINNQCIIIKEQGHCQTYDVSAPPAVTCNQCQSNYYLANQVCQLIDNPNLCQQSDGKTNACSNLDYFLPDITQPTTKNCFVYNLNSSNLQACMYCNKGYYYDKTIQTGQNICNQVPTITTPGDCLIQNYYSKAITCVRCISLKFPVALQPSLCSSISSTTNCLYSNGSVDACQNCKKTYGYKKSSPIYKCQSMSRIKIIQGCLRYDLQDNCEECVPNHYLSGTGGCLHRTIFDNCLEYDKQADQCLKCQQDFVLIVANTLHPFAKPYCQILDRENIILNCVEYALDSNNIVKCQKCYNSNQYGNLIEFVLDVVNNQCIDFTRKFCQDYNATTNTCNTVYILNCLTYSADGQKCNVCTAGYYLSSSTGQCIKNQIVTNCAKYSQTGDTCAECANLFYLVANTCINITALLNCQTSQLNNNSCILCQVDFSLNGSNVCVQNTGAYCTKISCPASPCVCDVCNDLYNMEANSQKCLPSSQTIPNCDIIQITTFIKCAKCATGYFYSFQNECLPQESLCSIAQCQKYEPTDSHIDQYYCSQCLGDYYVDQISKCSYDPPEPIADGDDIPEPNVPQISTKLQFFLIGLFLFIQI